MSTISAEIIPARDVPAQSVSQDSRALMSLIERLASSPEIDIARIEKMLELKEKWDASEARKAYTAAMAAFKAEPPTILKDKHVKFTSDRTGKTTEYDHATLGGACDAIIKGLSEHGISHRWDISQSDGRVKVTCILTHALGHSESVSMHGPIDDSGGKNAIQAISSSVSYFERYTLFAATGLASQDMDDDDDGRGGGEPKISEKQVEELTALITAEGGDLAKALRFMKISSLSDIPAKNFDTTLADIKAVNAARARAKRSAQ